MDELAQEPERIRRAVAGDLVALTMQLRQTRARLVEQLAVRVPPDLRGVLDADDLVQETHVEVFRHIGTFQPRGDGSFRRWVATIAIRKLRDAIKAQRTAKRGGGRRAAPAIVPGTTQTTVLLLDALAAPQHTPSRSAVRHETLEALERALKDLPDPYRRALTLVYLEDQPVAVAAAALGRTERAVHGLCRRALKLLRARLPENPAAV